MGQMLLRTASLLLALIAFTSCGSKPTLEVRPVHMRNLELEEVGKPMVRGEQRKLFYGAIGVREKEQRLGHYYVVLWNDDSVGQTGKVEFLYQQSSTGSKIHRQVQDIDASETNGRAEFRIIGDDYLKGGRVLAWKCILYRGGVEIASRQSYLWQ